MGEWTNKLGSMMDNDVQMETTKVLMLTQHLNGPLMPESIHWLLLPLLSFYVLIKLKEKLIKLTRPNVCSIIY